MDLQRSSGLLLHPTSLPGPGGCGSLGDWARRFVDRLAEAEQTWWQILPLNPPGHGGSPYSATSAFAGNPVLIDLWGLEKRQWLSADDISKFEADCEKFPASQYVIDQVAPARLDLVRRAAKKWRDDGGEDDPGYRAFCETHGAVWLDDFAFFSALKEEYGGASWQEWPAQLVRREPVAVEEANRRLSDVMEEIKFAQWQFFEQWDELRKYAGEKGVQLFGDLPIFVAMDSADAWANRRWFQLRAEGDPQAVAGVPPDYFSETGQRWGNPLYDWDALADDGYQWWVERVEQVRRTVDIVRVDHFRGFDEYWRIPAEDETAVNGRWEPGPKDAVFDAIRQALGEVPFVAEDLGTITDEVYALRDRQGLPGMKVLQFAFDGDPDHPFLPHTYPEWCVAYTGTHDNDTTRGWYEKISDQERHRVRSYFSHPDEGIIGAMIAGLWHSKAVLTIIPAQDLFGLGSQARMNTPGTAEDNWGWRMSAEQLEDNQSFRWLKQLTEQSGRNSQD